MDASSTSIAAVGPITPAPPPAAPGSRLLALPAELVSQVAFYAAPVVGPPNLLPLMLTHPTLARALSFEANPSLYASLLAASWDTAAVRRRFGAGALPGARLRADELRHRWTTLRTVRAFADDGAGWLRRHGQAAGLALIEQTMLEVFFLLTENDGLNLPHLLQWGRLVHFCLAYHTLVMLPASVAPGYPPETLGHGLHNAFSMFLDEAAEQMRLDRVRSGKPTFEETEDQTHEKMFVLRPFAFALHKYNPFFGPWNTPVLPLQTRARAVHPPTPTIVETPPSGETRAAEFAADPEGNQGGMRCTFTRFGKEWRMKSTLLNTGCVFGLLNALDRDPRVGGVLTDSSNSSTHNLDFLYTPAEAADQPPGRTPSYDPVSGTRLRRSVPVLHLDSTAWDLDVRRMLQCAELTSPGMKVSDWRGKFEGEWQGSFAFFDFNGYRDMLAGDEKALFENCFGQQGQQLIFHEEVVYVPRTSLGGTGTALNGGFPLEGEDVCRRCPFEEQDLDDAPDSEWVKELIIHGTGRSNWGGFKFRGRVRAFDGLLTVLKEYGSEVPAATQATRGNWLYRGYVTSSARLVGTWRDTFSPEDVKGYEGPFCLRKQQDTYLIPETASTQFDPSVAHFTKTMRSNMLASTTPAPPPPQTTALTSQAVFASTAADVIETLNKRNSESVTLPEPRTTAEMPYKSPTHPIASSSGQPRLPFIYPGFSREESARWDEHKARLDKAPEGWGVAIYDQVGQALAGTSTRDLPKIVDTNLKRERAHQTTRGQPDATADQPLPFPLPRKRKASPDVEDLTSSRQQLSKAVGKRPERASSPKHTSIYSSAAAAACTVGESVFKHQCDETLGSPEGAEGSSSASNAGLPIFRPHRNRSVASLLSDSSPPP